MGKTGSGKTTILEAIAGLRRVTQGSIRIDDRDVTDFPPAHRGIGYVPQDGALFNHMSVFENLAFGLHVRRVAREQRKERVLDLATLLEIRHLLARSPVHLSGGEKQRVALGRALAFSPTTLLLDEPLAALDDETREHMIGLIEGIRREMPVTVLHVTHSLAEAKQLADQIYVIEKNLPKDAESDLPSQGPPMVKLR
ncbi:MAG: ABC transporter ATP-binding protein [Planctomycetes bacterium]|nr:ABC transporter ATP-binding protein [Planctomycetota bacterium]